jgi:hypothetical protein
MNVRYRVGLSQAERDELTAMLSKNRAARNQRPDIAGGDGRGDEIAGTVASAPLHVALLSLLGRTTLLRMPSSTASRSISLPVTSIAGRQGRRLASRTLSVPLAGAGRHRLAGALKRFERAGARREAARGGDGHRSGRFCTRPVRQRARSCASCAACDSQKVRGTNEVGQLP